MPPSVLVIASHSDQALREELMKQLRGLIQRGHFDVLNGPSPGQVLQDAHRTAIERAKIAVVLLSVDLLAGEQHELEFLLERHAQGQLVLLPVRARPCLVPAEFAQLADLPRDGRVLADLDRAQREHAMVAIAEAIARETRDQFDPERPLGEQNIVERWSPLGQPLVAARVSVGRRCRVEVVGAPETVANSVDEVHVLLEFTRNTSRTSIEEVYRTCMAQSAGPRPFIAWCVRGPTRNGNFELDNGDTAAWQDARDTAVRTIEELIGRHRIHLFCQAPAALTLSIGRMLKGFGTIYLYNFVRSWKEDGIAPYVCVI